MFNTPARQAARVRNHRIRTLRMIYTHAATQVGDVSRRVTILQAIDRELIDLGAESHTDRIQRQHKEYEDAARSGL